MSFSIPLSSPKFRVFFLKKIIEFLYILIKPSTRITMYEGGNETTFETIVDFDISIDDLTLNLFKTEGAITPIL